MSAEHEAVPRSGPRFAFGENWSRFLAVVDESRIDQARQSLCALLGVADLRGVRFLDIGSGSGLFSLAARRLGATVHSFDCDPQSVACTAELRRRYAPEDPDWTVAQASVLDRHHVESLGTFDIVYSWGALHHTGNMTEAMATAACAVADGGRLVIAIYNDQGRASVWWLRTKQLYNTLPPALRWLVLLPAALRLWGPAMMRDLVRGQPFHTWRSYPTLSRRGMSAWHDLVDWVGGLPFEVASPEQIFRVYRDLGFTLEEMHTCAGSLGCNEYVFRKSGRRDAEPSGGLCT